MRNAIAGALCGLLWGLAAAHCGGVAAQPLDTRHGILDFDHGLPTAETRQRLYDELDFQQAVQAVIWAEPLVNNALFLRAMDRAGVRDLGGMLYEKRMHPGQETLTPNQSVVYLYDRINLREGGPVVHMVPPGPINAGFFDAWMRAVHDFGVVGPNHGRGDRILLVPPGYTGEIPDGYQIARPRTHHVFSITRVTVKEGMAETRAAELLRQVRTYRLADAADPAEKQFVPMGDPKAGGKEFRMDRPSGPAYWELLHRALAGETSEDRDRVMLGTLAGMGFERGRPFAPDARLARILANAEAVGRAMMVNESFSPRQVPAGLTKELYPGTHWENIQLLPDLEQEGPGYTYVTSRMVAFYQANGAQFAWVPRDFPPGVGQKYAATYRDAAGDWLKGEKSYRLRVPARVPVADFWSFTVYDVATRALVEAPQHVAEMNPSLRAVQANGDGSVDLYVGPEAPAGMESNWIQTVPGRAWFAYFRWYGPTEAYYDKSWRLPDVGLIE